MRLRVLLLCLLLSLWSAVAQTTAAGAAASPAAGTAAGTADSSVQAAPILAELDRLQGASTQTAGLIGRLRIEKWKADAESKRQAQSNAQSIQRNLTAALPGMISSVRSNPQDLGAQFKLYRNLNALYDVMSSLTESTGAFGAKSDYEALASQLAEFDSSRRKVGDGIEQMANSMQSQMDQLRSQVHTLQQAAVAAPPKKVVVDEAEPAKKASTPKKKKATTQPASSGGSAGASPPAAASPK